MDAPSLLPAGVSRALAFADDPEAQESEQADAPQLHLTTSQNLMVARASGPSWNGPTPAQLPAPDSDQADAQVNLTNHNGSTPAQLNLTNHKATNPFLAYVCDVVERVGARVRLSRDCSKAWHNGGSEITIYNPPGNYLSH